MADSKRLPCRLVHVIIFLFSFCVLSSLHAQDYSAEAKEAISPAKSNETQLAVSQSVISEAKAISIAEQFMKTTGEGLLNPRAVGAVRLANGGWEVGFQYTNPSANAGHGQAILMGADGQNVRLQHEEIQLSEFKRIGSRHLEYSGTG